MRRLTGYPEIKIKMGVKISGKIKITTRKNGIIVKVREQDNLIVNSGLALIRDLLKGKGRHPSHIEVGTSNTAATATQTALVGNISSADVPDTNGDTEFFNDGRAPFDRKAAEGFNKALFDRNLPSQQSNLIGENIREMGIFNRYVGGTMLARVVLLEPFEPFDIGFDHTIDWQITIERLGDYGGLNNLQDEGIEIIRDVLLQTNEDPNVKCGIDLPYHLSHISAGTGDSAAISTDTVLTNELTTTFDTLRIQTAHGRRPVTLFDRSESGDPDFDIARPNLVVQRFIPSTQFPSDEIKECGLWNQHDETPEGGQRRTVDKLFSKIHLDGSPGRSTIPAGTQGVLTWEIFFTRG